MQNKTLLVLFSVCLISCFALAVSAFSFGSSDKKDGAQEIVKRGGDKDDGDHKHGHDDDDHGKGDDHGHDDDDHGHDDGDCDDAISRASASFVVGGKTYKIPCGTGIVDINGICSDAVGGGGGVGDGSQSANLVFGTGTGAITSAFPCGTGTNNVPLGAICAKETNAITIVAGTATRTYPVTCGTNPPIDVDKICDGYCDDKDVKVTAVAGTATSVYPYKCRGTNPPLDVGALCGTGGLRGGGAPLTITVTQTVQAGSAGVCSPLTDSVTLGSGTNTRVVPVTCGGTGTGKNGPFTCPPTSAGTNLLVTVGTGTGATVSTVSCPTVGPQAVTIGTGTAARVTTVTC